MNATLLSTLLAFVLCFQVNAQSAAVSQISGTVHDPSGSVVPDVNVSIINTDTSATRAVQTAADGSYVVTNLPAGPYKLKITKDGFSTYDQTGIVIQVNSSPVINVALETRLGERINLG